MGGPNRLALQLDAEISAVITAMRQNAKWAVVPGKYNEEDQMEPEPHYEDFRTLRRKIFDWNDWALVQPLEYLAPFLKLVREPEVSGPITGVALTALWRLLSSGVLGVDARGAAEAVNAIVEDTTQCKFEATSPASDEVVLFNILQVLQAVVKCEAGVYLTDESVCKAYQAAFMLGNLDAELRSNRNSREVSELLTHYSRQIMGEITTVVFERLRQLEPSSPAADDAAAMSGVLPHISSVVAAAAAEAAAVKAAHAAEAAAAQAAALEQEAAAVEAAAEAKAAAITAGLAADSAPESTEAGAATAPAGTVQQQQQLQPQHSATATASVQTASCAEPRSPGAAAAVAAAAAAAAAAASSSGGVAPAVTINRQLSEAVGITGHHHTRAAGDDGSDADATFNSSSMAPGERASFTGSAAVSPAGDGSMSGYRYSGAGVGSYSDLNADELAPPVRSSSPDALAERTTAAAAAAAPGAPPPVRTGRSSRYSHGLPCAVEVLSFLIDCIAQRRADADSSAGSAGAGGVGGAADDDYAMFGLAMVHRALLAAGSSLQSHEPLLTLVHKELFAAMTVAASRLYLPFHSPLHHLQAHSASLVVVSGICQVLLAVWQVLGPCSIMQIEAILQSILLKMADGKETTSAEQQEAALEGLLDLTRCPGFMHAAFLSCDCRLERSNLFEDLAGLLTRTAFPGGGGKGLGPMHFISLEALLAMLGALAERLNDPPPQLQPTSCLGRYIDVWGPVCRGQNPPMEHIVTDTSTATAAATMQAEQTAGGSSSDLPGKSGDRRHLYRCSSSNQGSYGSLTGAAAAAAAELAAFEKGLKQRVTLAVDHFNKDYKKGFQFLQANKLLPELKQSDAEQAGDTPAAADSSGDSCSNAVDEDTLAQCIGYFLRVCPGLNKTTIGELLGEPDKFYLKVLDSFTSTFDFAGLSFDVGLRAFLECFKLPGEAQKIDRIINCFGRAYYKHAPDIFANDDAVYILAYSIILLNTDRHNSQVKKKMEETEFCRNLRGVNAGQDFPKPFLSAIYHSICKAPLRMSDTVGAPAVAGPAASASWAMMADRARTARGNAVILPPAVRHCFDTMMFRLVWGQCVHAMGVVLEQADSDPVVRAALDGLRTATRLAAHYDVDGVADSAVLVLAKFSSALNPNMPKPRINFGRDAKACAAVEAMFLIVTRYGDCVRSSWTNVLELVLRLDKLDLLPPALETLLDSDVWGVPAANPATGTSTSAAGPDALPANGTPPRAAAAKNSEGAVAAAGEAAEKGPASPGGAVGRPLRSARQRRAAGTSSRRNLGGGVGGGFLRSVTQLIALQDPEYEAKYATELEKEYEATALDVLHNKCAIQDVFADSRFLKPEALQALVAAIISAPGHLPSPPPAAAGQLGAASGAAGDSGYQRLHADRAAAGVAVDWEAAEFCLDLLLVVLLRNRDRLSLLWPPVFDHLSAIIRGKGVDGNLVAAAAVGLLRLCQRLLPCKPEAAEPLLRGLQLVPNLDPEVAWINAEVIAAEMLALVQVASAHIKAQWAWASACNLIKMTSVRPEAFPVSLEALRWVVIYSLTPLNYVLALEASVWFIERAALEHPKSKERCLSLLGRLTAWLEGWAASLAGAGLSREQLLTFSNAKSEFWLYLVEMLAKLAEHPDLQVRSAATAKLQQAAVAAEGLGVLPGSVERGLRERLLPPLEALSKKVTSKRASKDMPQAEVTVSELVRVVSKAMLLQLPQLATQPGFPALWLAVLGSLSAAAASGHEALSDAAAAALQNLLIMLHDMGVLQQGWSDSQHNLWQHTWHVAHKISSNLSPQMLSPHVNPARQQVLAAGGLQSLPQLPHAPPQLALQEQQQQAGYAGRIPSPVDAAAAVAAVPEGGVPLQEQAAA